MSKSTISTFELYNSQMTQQQLQQAITAWNTRPREAELEAEVGKLREDVRRALTYMDPMSPGHSSKKMADARRVLQVALSTIRAAKT